MGSYCSKEQTEHCPDAAIAIATATTSVLPHADALDYGRLANATATLVAVHEDDATSWSSSLQDIGAVPDTRSSVVALYPLNGAFGNVWSPSSTFQRLSVHSSTSSISSGISASAAVASLRGSRRRYRGTNPLEASRTSLDENRHTEGRLNAEPRQMQCDSPSEAVLDTMPSDRRLTGAAPPVTSVIRSPAPPSDFTVGTPLPLVGFVAVQRRSTASCCETSSPPLREFTAAPTSDSTLHLNSTSTSRRHRPVCT